MRKSAILVPWFLLEHRRQDPCLLVSSSYPSNEYWSPHSQSHSVTYAHILTHDTSIYKRPFSNAIQLFSEPARISYLADYKSLLFCTSVVEAVARRALTPTPQQGFIAVVLELSGIKSVGNLPFYKGACMCRFVYWVEERVNRTVIWFRANLEMVA